MGYVTRFTPHAQRDLLKIPRPDALRILHRLTELQKALSSGDPAALDIKALQGHSTRWRLRVGDYRVVYTIDDGRLIVWVMPDTLSRSADATWEAGGEGCCSGTAGAVRCAPAG